MAEQLDLSVAITPPSRTFYRVTALSLNWPAQNVGVTVEGSDGVGLSFGYVANEAVALMTALNTANLSVKSLQKRVIEKLQADGKLPAGSVTGTPA